VFHSVLVSSACYFFGGEFYNAKALAATVNVDPGEVNDTDLDLANSAGRMEPEEIDRAYLTLPKDQIVAMATLVRGAGFAEAVILAVQAQNRGPEGRGRRSHGAAVALFAGFILGATDSTTTASAQSRQRPSCRRR
jgi:hypothetical protein